MCWIMVFVLVHHGVWTSKVQLLGIYSKLWLNSTFENASKLFFVDLGNSMQKIAAFLKVLLLVILLNVSIVTT